MKRRLLPSWLRWTLMLLLVGGIYLLIRDYEQEFVYAPSTVIKKTPRDAKLAYDNIALTTDSGVHIEGWFIPAPKDDLTTTDVPPTVFYFHGSSGNIGDYIEKVHLLHDMSVDVFMIDYEGYGRSGGSPSEETLASDALTAYFYLTS